MSYLYLRRIMFVGDISQGNSNLLIYNSTISVFNPIFELVIRKDLLLILEVFLNFYLSKSSNGRQKIIAGVKLFFLKP